MTLRLVPDPFLHLTVVEELAVLHKDRRGVELHAGQIVVLRECLAELREQKFQLYSAVLESVIRAFDEAAPVSEADQHDAALADQVEREGAHQWTGPLRRPVTTGCTCGGRGACVVCVIADLESDGAA